MNDAARFWNDAADDYAKKPVKDMASYERTLEATRKHLATTDEVLEVGCGTGTTALRLAPAVDRILATDLSSRMIEIAREKAAAQGVANVRFECATLADDGLEPGSFDVVMAFNLLHLLEDVPGAIRRVHELLRPGGRFVSKTVCLAEQTRLWAVPLTLMRWVGRAPSVRLLTFDELEAMIAEAGFERLGADRYGGSLPSRFVVARKR